jgi:hypothetical protein
MKKIIKESISGNMLRNQETERIANASYRRIYKEIKDYCHEILEVYDENDEDQYTEGKVEAAQNILEMLRNL